METGTAGFQLIKSPWEITVRALGIPSVCIHNCDHFSSSSQVFFAKDDIVESPSTKIEKQIFLLIYYRNQDTWSPLGKHLLWQDCVPIVGISCLSVVFIYASLWCSVNSHVLFLLSARCCSLHCSFGTLTYSWFAWGSGSQCWLHIRITWGVFKYINSIN